MRCCIVKMYIANKNLCVCVCGGEGCADGGSDPGEPEP